MSEKEEVPPDKPPKVDLAPAIARLQNVFDHLQSQRMHNSPITPWVIDELRDAIADLKAMT